MSANYPSPYGEIGKHKRLKISTTVSSNLTTGTNSA